MKKSRRVLGKGLQALISESDTITDSKHDLEVNINDIIPSKDQPRKNLIGIDQLAESIKEHGVIQPIVVSETEGGKYQIIVGERRWRAAKSVGMKKIPAVVKNSLSSKDRLVIGLIENLQREDLNPIEEGEAYKELMDKFDLSAGYLSKIFGKDRTTITNTIRLLSLPSEVKDDLQKGKIQAGHARPLININDKKLILDIHNKIINDKISVREVERLIKDHHKKTTRSGRQINKHKNSHLNDIEERFQEKFSTKVNISGDNNKGKIIIEYYSRDDLNRFLEILNIT